MPSTLSPMSRLPYDVLAEIFTHCPPQSYADREQPNTRIAPILLCHVCSFWRTVALTSPMLWADLFYCFTMVSFKFYSYKPDPSPYKFVQPDIEFIQWWKRNQGSIPPSIVLNVRMLRPYSTRLARKLAGDRTDFLMEYLTSARFLQLDAFYWRLINDRINAGCSYTFPNLHHLAMDFGGVGAEDAMQDPFFCIQSRLPAQALSSLRQLSISNMNAELIYYVIPNHWSTLTHISLSADRIWLEVWFSLIRAAPNLQWGHFDISIENSKATTLPPCTLAQLTTLFVAVSRIWPDFSTPMPLYPLRLMFAGLQMPALCTLSLSLLERSWANFRGYTDLYGVLEDTPSITKLALGGDFLALGIVDTAAVLSAIHDIEPVWHRAPQLTHLQLDRPFTDSMTKEKADETMQRFLRNVCNTNNGWLDLQNPACPIQSITIRDTSRYRFDPPGRDFTLSPMQPNDKRVSEIVIPISAEFEKQFGKAMRSGWGERRRFSEDSFCKS